MAKYYGKLPIESGLNVFLRRLLRNESYTIEKVSGVRPLWIEPDLKFDLGFLKHAIPFKKTAFLRGYAVVLSTDYNKDIKKPNIMYRSNLAKNFIYCRSLETSTIYSSFLKVGGILSTLGMIYSIGNPDAYGERKSLAIPLLLVSIPLAIYMIGRFDTRKARKALLNEGMIIKAKKVQSDSDLLYESIIPSKLKNLIVGFNKAVKQKKDLKALAYTDQIIDATYESPRLRKQYHKVIDQIRAQITDKTLI